ncbi:dNA polymerase [Firmicutes bacterium CAG:95]|jgi:DNA polymerase|nr:dNA polymerase [Firmicutes bacterium CAG:95]
MRTLHIDIETFSSVNIKKSGLYKYVQSPDFEIILFAYAYDDEPVRVIDCLQKEAIPLPVIMDLSNPKIVKVAHNAAFEFYSLSKFYRTYLEQWQCTMVQALYCGFPGSLAGVGEAMNFHEDKKKMGIGKALIKYFCVPCAATKANGGRTRNYPHHNMQKWELFKSYNLQDVVTEREIYHQLRHYPVPDLEWVNWRLDQMINMGGTALDMDLVNGALAISDQIRDELSDKAKDLTGLDNPNSVAQLKKWVEENSGLEIESLNKATVAEILAGDPEEGIKEVLKIRKELGKTSVKKYEAMKTCVCEDGRVRGLLQFYGANRTGRFAGRLVQIQNLPKNFIGTLDTAREFVKHRQIEAVRMIYGNIPDTLSQLIRTAFVPGEGCHFCVADFSAIEARVLAWMAGEQWRLEVFRTHGKIYEASASAMFGVPIESIAKGQENYKLRAKGKVAELALGYGGGAKALIAMGALNMGLTEEELPDIVKRWRASSRRIYDFWYTIERAAQEAIEYGVVTSLACGVTISRDENFLLIQLPSGRSLFYNNPQLAMGSYGNKEICFTGLNQTNKKWGTITTWGGKLVENIIQAVSRDILCNAMMNLASAGYKINFHIHDEVILEVPDEDKSKNLEDVIKRMCALPDWANGLPLNAAGFDNALYYMKD